jgi:hypothetical protein
LALPIELKENLIFCYAACRLDVSSCNGSHGPLEWVAPVRKSLGRLS